MINNDDDQNKSKNMSPLRQNNARNANNISYLSPGGKASVSRMPTHRSRQSLDINNSVREDNTTDKTRGKSVNNIVKNDRLLEVSKRSTRKCFPTSPRLQPPDPPVVQAKLDLVQNCYMELTGRKLRCIPSEVKRSCVLSLDLDDNNLTEKSLTDIPTSVTSLSLSRNPLYRCSLPKLDNLHSLFLDHCQLTSFECFPFLPSLRFLSITNNKISTFCGLHMFPKLETLRIHSNKHEFDVVSSLCAFGTLSLSMFNDEQVTQDDYIRAYSHSSLVGISLRLGRDPVVGHDYDSEIMKSQKFLSHQLAKFLKSKEVYKLIYVGGDKPYIKIPIDASDVRWFVNCGFDGSGREWTQVPFELLFDNHKILKVTNFLMGRIVKAEFKYNKVQFSLYSDEPIDFNREELCLPFPITPKIDGDPLEGSLISLMPLNVPVRVAWVVDDKVIAYNQSTVLITNEENGKSIKCVINPYCLKFPNIVFNSVYTETGPVEPILPTVHGIQFPQIVIEDEVISFSRCVMPDREGDSEIFVERSLSPSSNWVKISQLYPHDLSFLPTINEVDFYLRVSYKPVTKDGIEGETHYFYSNGKVYPSLPRFVKYGMGGDALIGYPLIAVTDYRGGAIGECSFRWFQSKKPIRSYKEVKGLGNPIGTGFYHTCTEEDFQNYIVCELIPVRSDEVIGEPVVICTPEPVKEASIPHVDFEVSTHLLVGKSIEVHEPLSFLVSNPDDDKMFTMVCHDTKWKPKTEHAGKILRIVDSKQGIDTVAGIIALPDPVVSSLKLAYDDVIIGNEISLTIVGRRLTEENIEIVWCRVQGTTYEKPISVDTCTYTLKEEDVGYKIKVRVTPFSCNRARLQCVESSLTPTVKGNDYTKPKLVGDYIEGSVLSLSAFYQLTNINWQRKVGTSWISLSNADKYTLVREDIGHCIRACFNYEKISMSLDTLYAIEPSNPVGRVSFSAFPAIEDRLITPTIEYFGGFEGASKCIWQKREEEDWIDIANDVREYKPNKSDIGKIIRFIYIPVRADGVTGEECIAELTQPVQACQPMVKNVKIAQNMIGALEVTYDYFGGDEGDSLIILNQKFNDNNFRVISQTTMKVLMPTSELFGQLVTCNVLPLNINGTKGEMYVMKESDGIKVNPIPTISDLEILAKKGKLVPGSLIRVFYKIEPVEKGTELTFKWYKGIDGNWKAMNEVVGDEYIPEKEDVGYYIKCQIQAVNIHGYPSDLKEVQTEIPIESEPHINIDIINRDNSTTSKIKTVETGMILFANTNVSGNITWERSNREGWEELSQEESILVTVNDVGHRLRCRVENLISNETPIVVLDTRSKAAKTSVERLGYFRGKVVTKLQNLEWDIEFGRNKLIMTSKNGTIKEASYDYIKCSAVEGTSDEMHLVVDVSSMFDLIPVSAPQITGDIIDQYNIRDFFVATINSFVLKSN